MSYGVGLLCWEGISRLVGAAGAPQALPMWEGSDPLDADALLQVLLGLLWKD